MSRFSSPGRAQTLFSSEKRTGTIYRKPSTSFQSLACVNPSSRDLPRRWTNVRKNLAGDALAGRLHQTGTERRTPSRFRRSAAEGRRNFSPSSPSIRFGNRRRLKNSLEICAAHIPAALIFNTAWYSRSSQTKHRQGSSHVDPLRVDSTGPFFQGCPNLHEAPGSVRGKHETSKMNPPTIFRRFGHCE
jgi:hypothetical protein